MQTSSLTPPSHSTSQHPNVFGAIKQRGRNTSNLWFFQSPKNNARFTFTSDVAFMHFVLLEGDPTVSGYLPEPPPVQTIIDGEVRQTQLDAHVFFHGQDYEWWEFKRYEDSGPSRSGRSRPQLSAQAQAASLAGKTYRLKTDKDLLGREIFFDNWLTLCSCINRCRGHMNSVESQAIIAISTNSTFTLDDLLNVASIDTALMLASVGIALQRGVITCDLEHELLNRNTQFKRFTSGKA